MNDEQFLCEYIGDKEVVTVNGIQLQELLRAKKALELELRQANTLVSVLRSNNELLKSSALASDLMKPMHIDITA